MSTLVRLMPNTKWMDGGSQLHVSVPQHREMVSGVQQRVGEQKINLELPQDEETKLLGS